MSSGPPHLVEITGIPLISDSAVDNENPSEGDATIVKEASETFDQGFSCQPSHLIFLEIPKVLANSLSSRSNFHHL